MQRPDWQVLNVLVALFFILWAAISNIKITKQLPPQRAENTERVVDVGSGTDRTASNEALPDLGSHLMRTIGQNVMLIYPSLEVEELTVTGGSTFSVDTTHVLEGIQYRGRFGFGLEVLNQILFHSPQETSDVVREIVRMAPADTWRVPFPKPLNLGARAILGVARQDGTNSIVPLQVLEVFGFDSTAAMDEVENSHPDEIVEESYPDVAPLDTRESEIPMRDVEVLREYACYLAKQWWEGRQQISADCNTCKKSIYRSEIGFRNRLGFSENYNLFCAECFSRFFEPGGVLQRLRANDDFYLRMLVYEARHFVQERRRNP